MPTESQGKDYPPKFRVARRGHTGPIVYLGAALIVFLVFSVLAFRREPWPGAFGVPLSAHWWSSLVSRNIEGLPTYNTLFTDVTSVPGTDSFVAVGAVGSIARSDNGGETWRLDGTATSEALISVSFADDKIGWAVGFGGTILKTIDGGKGWAPQTSAVTTQLSGVRAISKNIAVAVGGSGTIVRTDDGGARWRRIGLDGVPQALTSIAFSTAERGLAVGYAGVILLTGDGGKTWRKMDSTSERALSRVRFFGSNTAWVAGDQGTLLRSPDGGTTWTSIDAHTNVAFGGLAPSGDDAVILVGSDRIFATNDTKRWTERVNPVQSKITSIALSKSGIRVAVGYAGTILVSHDGATWAARTMGGLGLLNDVHSSEEGTWIAGLGGQVLASNGTTHSFDTRFFWRDVDWERIVFAPNRTHGWVIGLNGELLHTENGGRSWMKVDKFRGIHTLIRDGAFVDERNGWLAGANLWHTTDGGQSWDSALDENFRTVAFADSKRGFVANTNNEIRVTEDGGVTWTEASVVNNAPRAFFVSNGHYVNGDRDHAWLAGTQGMMLRSDDGGHTWTLITTGQPEIGDIRFKDAMHGWLVGMNGVLGTTVDGGESWKFERVRDHVLRSIAFRDLNNGTAVGWGGKIIQTSDGGQTWTDYQPSWWPSPWYYASWLLVALIAAPAFRRAPPEPPRESTIANKLVSDRPIEAGEPDAFGLSRVARGLSQFLRNARTVPPLTVAVTGQWGSGKSSLMNLLAADLRTNGFRPVFFNAWHNEKEGNVLASLLEAIRKTGLPSTTTVEGVLFRAMLLWRRCQRHWMFVACLTLLLAASAGFLSVRLLWVKESGLSLVREAAWYVTALAHDPGKDSPALLIFLSAAISAGGFLWRSLKAFGVKPEEILAHGGDVTGKGKARPYHLRFSEQFHDVAGALAPRRMVIFVDDLDRCRPEYVLEALEAINFLSSSGECFVVMGLAPEQVKAAVGLAFKDIAEEMVRLESAPAAAPSDSNKEELSRRKREEYARQYLYKLVNMEIPVPEVGVTGARNILVGRGVQPRDESRRFTFLRPYVVAVGYAAAFASCFFAAQTIAQSPRFAPGANRVVTEPIAALTDARTKGADSKPVVVAPVSTPAAPAGGSSPVTIPPAKSPAHPVRYLLAAPFVGLWIAALVWLLRRRVDVVVRDSEQFTDALETWQPVLSQLFLTPRALKRFLNKVRYLAMLQREELPERTVWAAIARQFGHATSGDSEREAGALTETALVGLSALDEATGKQDVRTVDACRAEHQRRFGDVLDDGLRKEYLTLTQGLQSR